MKYSILLAFPLLLLAVACGGKNKNKTPTPVSTAPAAVSPTATVLTPATSPSPAPGSATPAPSGTTGPSPDGTVDPSNPGSTAPVHLAANPAGTRADQIILKDVRVGAHPEQGGWDRIVFEFASAASGPPNALPQTDIEYVEGGVASCGSGLPVPVSGVAVLRVKFTGAQAHDEQGHVSIQGQSGNAPPRVTGPGNSIVEAVQSCDFEGDVTWGVGAVAKQPFKVTTLTNPARVVIDIKWP